MRTIIAGSRYIKELSILQIAIQESKFLITTIISGCASGVDTLGELYAFIHDIPVKKFPADWDKYGKKAGMVRNKIMAENADALIAVWDGNSNGTRNMIDVATKNNLSVYVYIIS
jgi:hypothetical protein